MPQWYLSSATSLISGTNTRTWCPKFFVRILQNGWINRQRHPRSLFVGNHDMWMKDYFQKELQVPGVFWTREFWIQRKKFRWAMVMDWVPAIMVRKVFKKIFRNPVCQWLFGLPPPLIGVGVANYFSRKSRAKAPGKIQMIISLEKTRMAHHPLQGSAAATSIMILCSVTATSPFILTLNESSLYVNLGDWLNIAAMLYLMAAILNWSIIQTDIGWKPPATYYSLCCAAALLSYQKPRWFLICIYQTIRGILLILQLIILKIFMCLPPPTSLKMNSRGDSLAVFNDVKRFGTVTQVDATNPLKILLYYKNFSSIVVLTGF